jgi:DNA-binding transcriptional MerR regulator
VWFVESDLRSIGEMARACGLTVSALRFYDRVGVLVPAVVDPATGYRRYAEHQVRPARLLAGLRRVGVPLADIARVLGQLPDTASVRGLLDVHLRRLEDGLADARRELSRIHALLDTEESAMPPAPTRVTVVGADLAAAIDAVRFAVSRDPQLPALGGILVEVEPAAVRLVATDRYRLAVCDIPVATVDGPRTRVIAPASFVDQTRALLPTTAEVTITVGRDRISVQAPAGPASAASLDHDFPDYRRLLHDRLPRQVAHRVTVDVPALRDALAPGTAPTVVREHNGVAYDVAVLAVDADGRLDIVGEDTWQAGDSGHTAVNREFLLQALEAAGHSQLVLELDGPITPLAVRIPGCESSLSIMMPVRR